MDFLAEGELYARISRLEALVLRQNAIIQNLVMISDNRDLHFREREIRRELEAMGKMVRRDRVTGTASDGSDGAD